MRAARWGLVGVWLACALPVGVAEDPAARGWAEILTSYERVEGHRVIPEAYAPWVAGTEPGDPVATLLDALREGDGTYGGWIVDPELRDSFDVPRWLAGNLDPVTGPSPLCEPTLVLVVVAGDRTLALLVDEGRSVARVLDSAGQAPGFADVRGDAHSRKLMLAEVAPFWPRHADVLGAARRLSAEDRAVLAEPEELTIHALQQGVDWDGAWGRIPEGGGDPLARARAALALEAVSAGHVRITRPRVRARLGAGLVDLVTSAPGVTAACWGPHHVVHARRGAREVLAVLCLDCSRALIYTTGASVPPSLVGLGGSHRIFFELNEIFRLHGIAPPLTMQQIAERRAKEKEAAPK